LNKLYNIATYDMVGYAKNKQYREFAASAMAMSVMAVAIWSITRRKFPEDEEEIADAFTEQAVNMVPLVGKSIMAGKRGWTSTDVPQFEAFKTIGLSISQIQKGEFEAEDMTEYIKGLSVLLGVPYEGPKRVIRTIETGKPLELIGSTGKKKKRKLRKTTRR
jgi:hypothetical protein